MFSYLQTTCFDATRSNTLVASKIHFKMVPHPLPRSKRETEGGRFFPTAAEH